MSATFGIDPALTRQAIAAGDAAQASFSDQLKAAGQAVLDRCHAENSYAVVLASRPYQNDELVNHALPELFVSLGIPVLTNDSLPDVNKVDLSRSRLDIVNNYHARMLASAVLAAQDDCLEYVQIVSFGCGHDAYLSDEITRMMHEISGKSPLILKLDESDAQGSLRIRVRSFVETAAIRRARGIRAEVKPLPDPYPVKFTKADVKERVVLVPNTSHAFCRVMSAAFAAQHIRAVPMELGRDEAIRLGKQYVHNDICFPAQIVIGEALAALRSGKYDTRHTAVAMAKYIGRLPPDPLRRPAAQGPGRRRLCGRPHPDQRRQGQPRYAPRLQDEPCVLFEPGLLPAHDRRHGGAAAQDPPLREAAGRRRGRL